MNRLSAAVATLAWYSITQCHGTLAFAGESTDDEMPVVVIFGATPLPGSEQDESRMAAPVQAATAQNLDDSQATDITAYMNRRLGSVYVNDIQNNLLQADVSYRGYTASPLLGTPQGLSVYLDGMRMNQPFGDVVSWDLIPRAAITRLELMPGSNPLFGLNTLGGALSIRTKDGFSDPGTSVQLAYGTAQRRSLELQTGGHTHEGFYWYATANHLEDDGWRDDSRSKAQQAFGKLGWRSALTDIALSGAYADTDLNGNGLQEQRLLAQDYASVYTRPDNTANRAHWLNLTFQQKVGAQLRVSGNAYFRDIGTTTFNGDINDEALGENLYQPNMAEQTALAAAGYTGFPLAGETQQNTTFPSWRCIANVLLNDEPNEKCNGLANRTRVAQQDAGVSLQLTHDTLGIRTNRFAVGLVYLSARAHFLQSAQFGFLTAQRTVQTVSGPGAFADGTQDSEDADDARVDLSGRVRTASVFITDTLQIAERAHLTLSARADRTHIRNRDAITPGGITGSLDGDHRFQRLNPAAGLTVGMRGGATAYLGYAQSSRAPSSIELGCADPENPCRLPNSMAGDPPLDQVISKTFEAGVRSETGAALTWSIGAFRADNYQDILFVSSEQSGFGYFANVEQTRRQGLELSASSRVGRWRLGAHYTLLDATYQSEETLAGEANSANDATVPGFEGNIEVEEGDRIPLTPRHMFKTLVEWQVKDNLSLSMDALTLSGVYARGNENNQHQADGIYYLGPGRTGSFTVANLGAEWRVIKSLTLSAQIDNLFDRRYFTAAQLGATGFSESGDFVARPFSGPVLDGELPLRHATFFAPGAPRSFRLSIRYKFG